MTCGVPRSPGQIRIGERVRGRGGAGSVAPMPETTEDGHHVVVDGRRWRATDPGIPEALRAELVKELMRGRRSVKERGDAARHLVQDAKVALGERGEPWWEPAAEEGLTTRLAATMRALLRHRDGSTICPSDAARVVGGEDWRGLMDTARDVAATLHAEGVLVVQQKGEPVDPATATGPIRLAPAQGLAR